MALPLRATVAPAVLDAGLSVPEMVQVCGGAVVDWPTFAPAVPQPLMNRDTTDRQTTKIPSLNSLSLTGTLVLYSVLGHSGQRARGWIPISRKKRFASAFLGQSVRCHPEVALGGWGNAALKKV